MKAVALFPLVAVVVCKTKGYGPVSHHAVHAPNVPGAPVGNIAYSRPQPVAPYSYYNKREIDGPVDAPAGSYGQAFNNPRAPAPVPNIAFEPQPAYMYYNKRNAGDYYPQFPQAPQVPQAALVLAAAAPAYGSYGHDPTAPREGRYAPYSPYTHKYYNKRDAPTVPTVTCFGNPFKYPWCPE